MNIELPTDNFIVSYSFFNYLISKSGVPKVILEHQLMFNEQSISYVYLFSVKKFIFNDRHMLFCAFGLIINGKYKGVFQMGQIISQMRKWIIDGKTLLGIHLHHLMKVNINKIYRLVKNFPVPCKVYVHDYYLACRSYNLLKNMESFCGGKGLRKDLCDGCSFYKSSEKHLKDLKKFFSVIENRICFVTPSESTKEIFLNYYPEYKNNIIVIPHQKLVGKYIEIKNSLDIREKIKVAYLGYEEKHKGWDTWLKLIKKIDLKDYDLYVFNNHDNQYEGMTKVKIGYEKANVNAMTDALRKYGIDIAILWSIVPETYSYTCFEAFSANCFIITNCNSGNIRDAVNIYHNGIVLKNEQELFDLFENREKLFELLNIFKDSNICGPLYLQPNDEIVCMTLDEKAECILDGRLKHNFYIVNFPLLKALTIRIEKRIKNNS